MIINRLSSQPRESKHLLELLGEFSPVILGLDSNSRVVFQGNERMMKILSFVVNGVAGFRGGGGELGEGLMRIVIFFITF